jgi:hypothetical protein
MPAPVDDDAIRLAQQVAACSQCVAEILCAGRLDMLVVDRATTLAALADDVAGQLAARLEGDRLPLHVSAVSGAVVDVLIAGCDSQETAYKAAALASVVVDLATQLVNQLGEAGA